ncbi:mycobactin biosynthesis acyl-ACP dehydrogenase MbtN [Mycolicibacterium neoaurum]|uniref:mycobactin biosynthesis acyl-ACP dehydrogenase MbtN n=1 Tax=Mycolicibacterium neoaurum TaxID=1795 RepID=UPI00248BE202|nr:mycobactin biosynthesis acyl-ACP dehydrogenase MbtN [Mycolicibacterium neoaurum]WBP95971.1 mycobactin biosynthesis acyl-ACP dehydrogenase MbtN [Mycolicibacterium neoaurum]WBS09656.1 mycobactin biosynthesis acyl-ACP dehydrogenase MbtN [Mycolicibacterium neoaurum]
MTVIDESPAATLDEFEHLLDRVFDDRVRRWTAEAERTDAFPRELIEYLGREGVFEAKWGNNPQPDVAKVIALALHLGRLGSAGIAVGVSLHDSAIALLRRFGRTPHLKSICERAIRGEVVLCVGASEESGGSDLQIVGTTVRSVGDGFQVTGIKKFVSLSPIADYVMTVARNIDGDPDSRHGNVVVIAVPLRDPGVQIQRPYKKVGAGPLDTAAVHIDTWVPADALIARAGTGLAAISWGLAHERMSVAGQIAGSCQRLLGITLARMMSRRQFGHTLYEHQALRMRVADLQARVDMLRHALNGIAAGGKLDLRTAAAMKVCAARLGEEVVSECMHIFGGTGYLVDETPLGRWWRDMKLARVGGGTDEVLWELVAAAMKPDHDGYAEMMAAASD